MTKGPQSGPFFSAMRVGPAEPSMHLESLGTA
jgi:hypothetical protein